MILAKEISEFKWEHINLRNASTNLNYLNCVAFLTNKDSNIRLSILNNVTEFLRKH